MRRTAAGSALVCAGFALGALGATLAAPQPHQTAIAFLHAGDAPHLEIATHARSVPVARPADHRTQVVRGPLTKPRTITAPVAAPVPGTTAPATAAAAPVSPQAAPPLSLDVALDPARTLDAVALDLQRILASLTGGQR